MFNGYQSSRRNLLFDPCRVFSLGFIVRILLWVSILMVGSPCSFQHEVSALFVIQTRWWWWWGGGTAMNQEIDQWQTSCQANDKGERVWCTSVNTSPLVLLYVLHYCINNDWSFYCFCSPVRFCHEPPR